ncbi:hypothetical protein [Fluviispira multicolorata]|uniref:Uncharacterized protein n=1 Tax=Fluviispira multicolorata TaxID=2654512 RepID=A0A833N3C6_9BACT|nr:hypothetical protein [Fluviispira multicolorata]KAB8028134.1 hypothetical protein GCL57_13885 [Fluviispira multicolorata]
MKFKVKDHVKLARGIEFKKVEECILRVLDYATQMFEKENLETNWAHLEANKVVFGYPQHYLNGSTVAQWLAGGGDERHAFDAVKDYITEAKKVVIEKKVQKTVAAKVFRSG